MLGDTERSDAVEGLQMFGGGSGHVSFGCWKVANIIWMCEGRYMLFIEQPWKTEKHSRRGGAATHQMLNCMSQYNMGLGQQQ